MKRSIVWAGLIFALFSVGLFAYTQFFGSPEVSRDRYLTRARAYLKESKVKEAIIEFRNAVKADPRSAEARLEFGMTLFHAGDVRGEYQELVRAVDLKPDSIKARYQLADIYLLGRRLKDAKEQLEKLRELSRNAHETRYLAASIAMAEGEPDRAISELNEILLRDSTQAMVYIEIGGIQISKKEYKLAETSYRKALEINPNLTTARVALAQLYVSTGDSNKAEDELISATKADPENEGLLHVLGNFYSITKRIDEFEKLYTELLKRKPNSLIAKKRLAEFYLTRNEVMKARNLTDEILKTKPGDIDGHFFRGRIFLTEKNPQRAIEDLTISTTGAQRFGPGFYYLGQSQVAANQIENAKKSFSRAIELVPNWIPPRLMLAEINLAKGENDLALEQSDKILQSRPDHVAALIISGAARLKKGEADKALALFKRAQAGDPNNSSIHSNLGAVYVLQKKYSDGAREYQEALRLAPDQIDSLVSLVQIDLIQGEEKRALQRAQQLLPKTKKQADVYQLMGRISLVNKDFGRGIEYLEKAVNLNPDLASAYYALGNAYVSQQKFGAAMDQYQKVIGKDPKAIPPRMMMGILYELQRQPAKANEYYQKVLDIKKDFSPAANQLAWNYAEHGGNLDVAVSLAQRAREISPNDPVIADTLGWIYYKKGVYASAIALLKESNEKFKGENATVLYHLGAAYAKNKDKILAQEALRKALAASGNFTEAAEAQRLLSDLETARKS